jgi:protein-disulfide isomerase-like protein with CxxC motif
VIEIRHFSDPGCPWAWSASPHLSVLHWRYGDQLRWRLVMIGLTEHGGEYERRGYTAEGMARGFRSFRRRGMPFATLPREHVHGTWPMCRAVVAARLTEPEREWSVFRALQVAQFTTTLDLETTEGIRAALERVPGLDVDALLAAAGSTETEVAFAADRAEARSAAGSPTEFQGKSATTPGGEVRYTAPSLLFSSGDGRTLEAGGFQSTEAYDVLVANLDPSLRRRGPAEDAGEVLAAFPDGVSTAEVAAVMAPSNTPPDLGAAEDELIALAASGDALRRAVGHDALWAGGELAADRLLRSG